MSQKQIKKSEVLALEQKIQQIRRQYKEMAKGMGKCNDEDVRNRLNDLAIELQEKSEELTILKKKK